LYVFRQNATQWSAKENYFAILWLANVASDMKSISTSMNICMQMRSRQLSLYDKGESTLRSENRGKYII